MSSSNPNLVKVLLVDDDEADVLLTTKMLQRGKLLLDVSVAHDGEMALEMLHDNINNGVDLPDLLLLDINMPRMTGLELLEAIRSSDGLHRLPVVMLTTSDAPQDIQRVYDLGANCYITKPVTFDQFQRVISVLKDFWFTVVKLPPQL